MHHRALQERVILSIQWQVILPQIWILLREVLRASGRLRQRASCYRVCRYCILLQRPCRGRLILPCPELLAKGKASLKSTRWTRDNELPPSDWPRVRRAPPNSETCNVLEWCLFSKDRARTSPGEYGLSVGRRHYLFEDLDILELTFIPYPFCLGERFSQVTLDTRRFPSGKLAQLREQLVGTRRHKPRCDNRFHQPLVRVESCRGTSASMYKLLSGFTRLFGTGLLICRS